MNLRLLDSSRIPNGVAEREETLRLVERDAVLHNCALLIESDSEAAQAIAGRLGVPVALAVQAHHAPAAPGAEFFTIDRPPADEQQAIWRYALNEETALRCNGSLERASEQFSFDTLRILDIARRVNSNPDPDLWAECRAEARPLLDGLAQRVETNATWDDLVLPEAGLEALRAMIAQVLHQDTVLRRWGFAGAASRGLGVSALFHGQSGTGKTLAAEVVANELKLDLYRIDLSQVVSKYIGETEKNLSAVFDAAENTGAVLLFDEADALFGKRSEVRDSHDRYANIEIGYLLQRMEAYRGIALLTTNMRNALDAAFLRRIRFVIHFPFPDQELRRRIWLRMFPTSLPVEGVDVEKLARLNLPGGNIRNIALSAAYLAADADEPVRMSHLLAAARRECAKLDRAPADREIGGWV
jgi:AAA+ superfamily predicted ATPase